MKKRKYSWNVAQRLWATIKALWPWRGALWSGTAYELEHFSGLLSRALKDDTEWLPYRGQFGRLLAILSRSKLRAVIRSRSRDKRIWTIARTLHAYDSFLKLRHSRHNANECNE